MMTKNRFEKVFGRFWTRGMACVCEVFCSVPVHNQAQFCEIQGGKADV